MDQDIDTNIGTSIDRTDSPDAKWVAWAIWSSIALVLTLFMVFAGGMDPGALLGWVVGVTIAAMLMVFRR